MEALDAKEIEHNFEWRIINTSELEKFSHKIFDMYNSSYKDIGVIDFASWEGLAIYLNCSCYLLTDSEDDIHGIILYWLAEYGNKISLVISETPEIGNKYVVPKLIELIKTPGFYVELSDKLEYIVNFKNNIQNITDKKVIKLLIPGLKDEDIFSKNDIRRENYLLSEKYNIPSNEGSYLREIRDFGIKRKAVYGIPCLNKTFIGDGCNRKCELPAFVASDATVAIEKIGVEAKKAETRLLSSSAPGVKLTVRGGKSNRKSNRKPTRKYKKKSNRKPTRKSTKKSNRKPTRKSTKN